MSISMKWLWKLICKAREGYSPTTPSEKNILLKRLQNTGCRYTRMCTYYFSIIEIEA